MLEASGVTLRSRDSGVEASRGPGHRRPTFFLIMHFSARAQRRQRQKFALSSRRSSSLRAPILEFRRFYPCFLRVSDLKLRFRPLPDPNSRAGLQKFAAPCLIVRQKIAVSLKHEHRRPDSVAAAAKICRIEIEDRRREVAEPQIPREFFRHSSFFGPITVLFLASETRCLVVSAKNCRAAPASAAK